MKFFLVIIFYSLSSFAQNTCPVSPVDYLMIGDSQTGAFWASGYFGNYIQKCMREKTEFGNFVIYGRGGSEPKHWVDNSGLDKIETIQRDNLHNHLSLGTTVPACQRRITPMLEMHDPKKVMVFLGDNLLTNTQEQIITQFKNLLSKIKERNITKENCFFVTPTYEMAVTKKRNVPAKNLVNTQAVIAGIKTAVEGNCQVIDGLDLMKDSDYYLADKNLLMRVPRPGGAGCMGASENDNIHICGEAAYDFANRVCAKIVESSPAE